MPGPPKGTPKPQNSGRKAGTPNKTTTALREAILRAADEAEEGGKVAYLRWLAKNNSSAFAMLLGKVLPTEMTVKDVSLGKPPERFVPSQDVMDASERYQRALRGEDFNPRQSPALAS